MVLYNHRTQCGVLIEWVVVKKYKVVQPDIGD